jgi:hypothetical protein
MRYFSYNDYNEDHPAREYVVTKSEDDIRDEFWSYWYEKMCEKYEKSYVDETYSFEDCLEDWCSCYGAWKVE